MYQKAVKLARIDDENEAVERKKAHAKRMSSLGSYYSQLGKNTKRFNHREAKIRKTT